MGGLPCSPPKCLRATPGCHRRARTCVPRGPRRIPGGVTPRGRQSKMPSDTNGATLLIGFWCDVRTFSPS
eukprot:3830422-Alexandrium_andersonii.AAC.1